MKLLVFLLALVIVIIAVTRIIASYTEVTYGDEKEAKTIRIVGTTVPIGIFLVVAVIFSIYFVDETENAVIETLGVPSLVEEAGPHFKIPFIQSVEKVDTTSKKMAIGYAEENDESVEAECLMITNDYNFVNVDFDIDYIISSPIDYIYSVKKPEAVLKNILLACIRSTVSNYTVDGVLTTEKGKIETDIEEAVLKALEEENIGISVTQVRIQDADPPTKEIISAFKAVEDAKQNMDTKINEAKAYEAKKIPENEAKVDKILQDAETKKEARINEAHQQVAMFNAMYEEYVKDKETTKKRMFFEAMEDILPNLKVIVGGSEMDLKALYPIETFSATGGTVNE